MYALVDCNNFYASCERVFQPQYIGKPIVVLSNNDGCVISRSDEAKSLGIPMGAPEFKIRSLLTQKNIKVFSSNYALYGDLSNRVMQILNEFSPHMEIYSIDEAFMNFEGIQISNFHDYGTLMRNRVQKWVGIPISVGFASTKALSKVANKIARKFPERTKGVYCIDTEEKRIRALQWTKIEDVWGIGRKHAQRLQNHNVLTAYQFTLLSDDWVRKNMSVIGLRLKHELEGKSVLSLEPASEHKKSIAVTRSFPKQLSDFDALKERVSTFATVCAEKLRKQQSCCQTIIVMLLIDKHQYKTDKYYFNRAVTLPFATQSSLTIANASIGILKELLAETKGAKFKKAGVIVTGLTPENNKQFHLFEEENPKHLSLMKTIDSLNQKIGTRKIKLANQNLNLTWDMNQNYLSPKYTTNFNEILEINVDRS
ncbi:Y-family DNA polymerase [Flavobacterium luminosum]|uniref:Y-family DNA polymerase n=1 Tax=Flavobacterium luminosum TaxID=2949086 RepID=A0ABT0TQ12_9FLAO|nr:Y-family DNA polymerase [Flavobacterium sp. HXWNR70]MCL9809573.1 Y-family DNA polymerase [Flavobacterium sp. HXWNR70]